MNRDEYKSLYAKAPDVVADYLGNKVLHKLPPTKQVLRTGVFYRNPDRVHEKPVFVRLEEIDSMENKVPLALQEVRRELKAGYKLGWELTRDNYTRRYMEFPNAIETGGSRGTLALYDKLPPSKQCGSTVVTFRDVHTGSFIHVPLEDGMPYGYRETEKCYITGNHSYIGVSISEYRRDTPYAWELADVQTESGSRTESAPAADITPATDVLSWYKPKVGTRGVSAIVSDFKVVFNEELEKRRETIAAGGKPERIEIFLDVSAENEKTRDSLWYALDRALQAAGYYGITKERLADGQLAVRVSVPKPEEDVVP